MADKYTPDAGFTLIVKQILEANNFVDLSLEGSGLDLLVRLGNTLWAVEVKYYRTKQAQIGLLEAAASQLVARAISIRASKGMLIVSCVIPPAVRKSLEDRYGVLFVDRADLFVWAATHTDLVDALASSLEDTASPDPEAGGRKPPPKLGEDTNLPQSPPPRRAEGANLCKELRALRPGTKTWSAHEKLCERILRYLFVNDLHGWHKQKRSEDGRNRMDLVCRVRSNVEFWRFLADNLNSRYVVFEFKNYKRRIKQAQMLTTEKYLMERALRRVAITLSRSGADDGAAALISGAMREHGKLMLVLDDDDICKMLHLRDDGEDPADLLFDVADDFLLSLPR